MTAEHQPSAPDTDQSPFLRGGGEMGRLTRAYNWRQTSLGSPDTWPQSLRTTLSIILNSKFPMFLFWGPELLCFYNDAYRPSLGNDGKHPQALGKPGAEVWPEIWPVIKPLIDQVLLSAEATWSENQLIPIYRNGTIEDVYWTFSYSPVSDESGHPAGVFVTCTETTEQVAGLKKLRDSERYFHQLTDTAPAIIWETRSDGYCTHLNRQWYAITGQTEAQAEGFGWLDATHPDDQAEAGRLFVEANANQAPFYVLYRLRHKDGSYRWSIDKGNPRFGPDGAYEGMVGTVTDVHEQQSAEQQQREKTDLLQVVFDSAAAGLSVFRSVRDEAGEIIDFEYQLVNRLTEQINKRTDLVGKRCLAVHKHFNESGLFDDFKAVVETGQPLERELHYTGEGFDNWYVTVTVKNDDGVVYSFRDITPERTARQQIDESEERFRTMAEDSDLLIAVSDETGQSTYLNQAWVELTGRSATDLLHLGWVDLVHPDDQEPFLNTYRSALSRQESFSGEFRILDKHGAYRWLLVNCPARYRSDGLFTGYISSAIDITDRKQAEEALRAGEARFRSLVQEAPVATMLLTGPNHVIELANDSMIAMLGKGPTMLGKPAVEAVPELAAQTFLRLLDDVYTTGVTHQAKAMPGQLVHEGVTTTHYFDFTYKPMRNVNGDIYGIMSMAVDVTHQVVSRQKLAESEAKLRSVVETAPVAIGLFMGRDLVIELPNQTFIDIVGKGPDIVGKPLREVMPELITENQPFLQILDDVYTSGQQFHSYGSMVQIVRQGVMTHNYYNITYTPLFNETGDVYAILDIAVDVTGQIKTQQELAEKSRDLELAISIGQLGSFKIDLISQTATYSALVLDWFGLSEQHQPLATIFSGIHAEDQPGVVNAIEQSILGDNGGHHDLTYRIISSKDGQLRYLHSVGQTQLEAGVPVSLSGIIQDVTGAVIARHELEESEDRYRRLSAELDQQVQERTEQLQASVQDLSRSNSNLQQFAYIASHDLQEPLRKIQSFGDLLKRQYAEQLGEGVDHLQRMQTAAGRMSVLIKDLLTFSRISTRQNTTAPVSLSKVVANALSDLDLVVSETGAQVDVEPLPTVPGDESQLGQLFQNLLSNALKFRRPAASPVVRIRCHPVAATDLPPAVRPTRLADTYYQIDVSDNGIGFDDKYVDRIFQVFQRLHGRNQYAGTGIGLAICEKVAANHGGAITATSQPGQGATFSVYLPM